MAKEVLSGLGKRTKNKDDAVITMQAAITDMKLILSML